MKTPMQPNEPVVPPKMEDKIPSNEQSSSSSIRDSPANPSTDIKRLKTSEEAFEYTPTPVSPVPHVPFAMGVDETQDSLKIRATQASPDIDVL